MTAPCLHPAIEALRHIRGCAIGEVEATLISGGGKWKSAVYRISQPRGSIIGKRCLADTAQVERRFYEQIAAALPVPCLEYYGVVEAGDGYHWIFIEDSGGQVYTDSDEHQRAAAAQWFAAMHAATAPMVDSTLADRTSAGYLKQLRSARANILTSQSNPVFLEEDRAVLSAIARKLDRIEGQWRRIESVCNLAPTTFVHADLQPKNLHVRCDSRGVRVYPLDWEHSGWGCPAVDMAYLDIASYYDSVQPHWPRLTLGDAMALARVGRFLQMIAAVEWETLDLEFSSREHVMEYIQYYDVPEDIDEVLDCQC